MSAFDDWYKQMFCEKPLIAALQTEPYDFRSYSRDDLEQAFNAGRKLGNNEGMERAEKITLTTFPNNWLNEEGYKASLTIAAYIRKEIEK